MLLVLGHKGFLLGSFLKEHNKPYISFDEYNNEQVEFGFFFAVPKFCSDKDESIKMIDALRKLTGFIDVLNANNAKLVFASSEGVHDYDMEDYIYLYAEEYIVRYCNRYLILRIPTVISANTFNESGYEFDYITLKSFCDTLSAIYESETGIFNFKTKHIRLCSSKVLISDPKKAPLFRGAWG